MDYRIVAIQVGDLLKWSTSINQIDRLGQSTLRIIKDSFPNESITSGRAQCIYDWILSIARTSMNNEERDIRVIRFCCELAGDELKDRVVQVLIANDFPYNLVYKDGFEELSRRNFHEEVLRHSKGLYLQGNYFHAVFEASKAYNNAVKSKSRSELDGESLMMSVWGCERGVLKVTGCESETDRNIQDGIKFLSSGLMRAIRNPTAHEPAVTWPINKQDCLDILSFISFLFRQLDSAVYFPST